MRHQKALSPKDGLRLLIGRVLQTDVADANRLSHLSEQLVERKEEAATAFRALQDTVEIFVEHLRDCRATMAWLLGTAMDTGDSNSQKEKAVIMNHVQKQILHRLPKNLVGMVTRTDYICPACGHIHAASIANQT